MSDDTTPRSRLGRRRRANVRGGRRHSHMVRVTPEEEALLAQLAETRQVTIPRLLIEAALSADAKTPTERREVNPEFFAILQQLAGVARNVNQLARTGNIHDRLPVATSAALDDVRGVVAKINAALDGLDGVAP